MKILPWCFLVVLSVAFACNPAAFAQGCGQVPTVLDDVICCPDDPPELQTHFPNVICGGHGSCRDFCYEGSGNCSYCTGVIYYAANVTPEEQSCIDEMDQCVRDGGVWKPAICDCYLTPIIIDTSATSLRLTSSVLGVYFQFSPTGQKIRVAWTEAGDDGDAFLVLDRNDNGLIDDGTELFGNLTPQPTSEDPNGFLALAVFDKQNNGGNGDGVIDHKDVVFSRLRLWVDANHDGISQAQELHNLPELGVFSLSLSYRASSREDRFGNMFRYRAMINPSINRQEPKDGRWAYDVYLLRARTTSSTEIGVVSSRCGASRKPTSDSPSQVRAHSPAPSTEAEAPERRLQ